MIEQEIKKYSNYRAKSQSLGGTGLFEHGIAAAVVCSSLVERVFPEWTKNQKDTLKFFASIHDVGKIWPGQQEIFDMADKGERKDTVIRHEIVSAYLLKCYLDNLPIENKKVKVFRNGEEYTVNMDGNYLYHNHTRGLDRSDLGQVFFELIVKHHDKTNNFDYNKIQDINNSMDTEDVHLKKWHQDGLLYIKSMISVFKIDFVKVMETSLSMSRLELKNCLAIIFLADWIASQWLDNNVTGFQDKTEDILNGLGLFYKESIQKKDFEDLNPFAANSLQKVCTDMVNKHGKGLYLIEANTGNGKTEAAFFMSYLCQLYGINQGVYFALPTKITADKIYERMVECIAKFSDHNPNLIHSDASLLYNPDLSFDDEGFKRFFLSPKKAILEKNSVGTIDQCLMGEIDVKHSAIRQLGLVGKVLIIDEIHSYDPYMMFLIEKLVKTAIENKCTVIMMTATMPISLKRKFIGNNKSSDCYPLVTYVNKDIFAEECVEIETREQKYSIETMYGNTDSKVDEIVDLYLSGKNVLVICNTIKKAVEFYKGILSKVDIDKEDIGLLHSNFLKKKRNEIEKKWTNVLGKTAITNKTRKPRSILISTQIVEQSIDIDADVLFTELAPMDLLIQRCGRLHRHVIEDRNYEAKCFVMMERDVKKTYSDIKEVERAFGASSCIYPAYYLFRTYHAVVKRYPKIILPEMSRTLVDLAYDNTPIQGVDTNTLNFLEDLVVYKVGILEDKAKQAQVARLKGRDEEGIAKTRNIENPTYTILLVDDINYETGEIFIRGESSKDYKSSELSKWLNGNSMVVSDWKRKWTDLNSSRDHLKIFEDLKTHNKYDKYYTNIFKSMCKFDFIVKISGDNLISDNSVVDYTYNEEFGLLPK